MTNELEIEGHYLGDLIKLFDSGDLKEPRIVEVDGGYRFQYRINNCAGITGVRSYWLLNNSTGKPRLFLTPVSCTNVLTKIGCKEWHIQLMSQEDTE